MPTLAAIRPGLAEDMQVFAACFGLHCKLPRVAGDSVVLAMLIGSIQWANDKKQDVLHLLPLASSCCPVLNKHLQGSRPSRFPLGSGRAHLGHQNWTRVLKGSLLTCYEVRAKGPLLGYSNFPQANLRHATCLWPCEVMLALQGG